MERARISFPEKEEQKKTKPKISPRRKSPRRQHSPIRNRSQPRRDANQWRKKTNWKKREWRKWKSRSNNNGQHHGGGRIGQQGSESWRAEHRRSRTPQPAHQPIMVISSIPYPGPNPSFIAPPHPIQYISHPPMPHYFPHPTPPQQQYHY